MIKIPFNKLKKSKIFKFANDNNHYKVDYKNRTHTFFTCKNTSVQYGLLTKTETFVYLFT